MKRSLLFFIDSLGGGGAEKILSELVAYLNKSKYEITVCTVVDGGIYENIIRSNANYYSLLKRSDYKSGWWKKALYWFRHYLIYRFPRKIVYRMAIRQKYDVEIAFLEGFATSLISSSNNKKSKKIAWLHTDLCNAQNTDYLKAIISSSGYDRFDQICCVSKSVYDGFVSLFPSLAYKTLIRYNPINAMDIIKKGSESIEIVPNSTLQLCTVGRLEPPKGYSRLMDCLNQLRECHYDYSLWIIGDGSQRDLLEQKIAEYSLNSKVILLGFQTNPYKYVSKCDAFLCSSYVEGFSTSATEAIILGKPVFTVDCAGMHELFANYRCGEIVENTDDSLIKILDDLLSQRLICAEYREAVFNRAKTFDLQNQIEQIEFLLDS